MRMETPAKRCPLIGRRAHLEKLAVRRKAATAGHGSIVLLSGEAGSGKTRLLEEFAATVADSRTIWIAAPAVTEAQKSSLRAAVEARMKRSTVIFVEGAHLAAREFLDELFEIGERVEGSRLLLVVSFRRAELERDQPATILLGRLARLEHAASLEVEPLDRGEMRALVHALLDDGVTLSPHTMERLERLCGGNPLLLAHLVAHAITRETNSTEKLPLAVSGMISEWLLPLSDSERNVLAYAALMRGPFDAADVTALCEAGLGGVAPVLRRASLLNILTERRGGGPSYVFRHWVVAEMLERHFLPHEAKALHAKIASAIESTTSAEVRAGELAAHWQEAGNMEAALRNARRAGDRAFALADYRDAAYWYERAITAARAGALPFGDLYEKLANALERSGYSLSSHRALQVAAEFSDARGETARAVHLRIADAMAAHFQCDLSAGFRRVRAAISDGLPVASQRYAQVVAAALLSLRQDTEGALALLADFPIEDATVDAAALAKYWEVVGYIALQRSDPQAAREAFSRCLAVSEESGDPGLRTEAEGNLALYELQFAEPSLQHMPRAIALAQEHGHTALEAVIRGYCAIDHFVRGRLADAREQLQAILSSTADTPGALVVRTYAGLATGRALCDDSLIEACARPQLFELLTSGSPASLGRGAGPYAQWLIDTGRSDEARALLHRCVAALRNAYGTFLTMPVVATYADEVDVQVARSLLAVAAQNPHDRVAAATLELFDALCAHRHGAAAAAAASAALAAERFAALGWTTLKAWALELSGARAEALQLYQRCGNIREIRRLELPTNGIAGRGDGILSPRERNIAALVAEGKSNRAVAASLALSEKTVEGHLTTIFEKLGFRSRTELAASAAAYNKERLA